MQDFRELLSVHDPVKKRAWFIGLLSREVARRGGKYPIIVGGHAVEIYTQGSYTTGDIDIKTDLEAIDPILREWGFSKVGRIWINKDLDIFVDWLGSSLDEGEEAEKRTVVVKVADDLEIRVLSFEDLIIDRLNAFKWWGDEDSLMWAKVLVKIKESIDGIDEAYIRGRARKADLTDLLEAVMKRGK